MKRNKAIIRILLFVVIMLFFVLTNKSLGASENFGPEYTVAYNMSGSWTAYCRFHGKALGGVIGGLSFNHVTYQSTGEYVDPKSAAEPATAYALYCGAKDEELQKVIWYSKIWTGGSNSVVDAGSRTEIPSKRYLDYGNVYYYLIKPYDKMVKDAGANAITNLFTVTDDVTKDSVKLMVNQSTGKYIVGPYKLQLNPSIAEPVINSNTITNSRQEALNKIKSSLEGKSKITETVDIKPTITENSISLGDIVIETTNKYYNGESFRVPTKLTINGQEITDNKTSCAICQKIQSKYDKIKKDYDDKEKAYNTAKTDYEDAEKEYNKYAEKNESDSDYDKTKLESLKENDEKAKTKYENAKEEYNALKEKLARITVAKDDNVNHLAYAMLIALLNDYNHNSKITDSKDVINGLQKYYDSLEAEYDDTDNNKKDVAVGTIFDKDNILIDSESKDKVYYRSDKVLSDLSDMISKNSKTVTSSYSSEDPSITISYTEQQTITKTIIDDVDATAKALLDNDISSNTVDETTILNKTGVTLRNEAKTALYNELVNEKNNSKHFAKFDINTDLTGINGSGCKLIDASGNEISFPDFINNTPFYIEFTPSNNGNIQYVGTPKFTISWINSFNTVVNDAWNPTTIVSNYGRPTDYIQVGPTRIAYGTSRSNYFEATRQVMLLVKVGKNRITIGQVPATIYCYRTDGIRREHTVPTPQYVTNPITGNLEFTGYYIPTVDYIFYECRTDEGGWKIDESKSSNTFTYSNNALASNMQRITGKFTSNGKTDFQNSANWEPIASRVKLGYANNVEIGGTVWLETPGIKNTNYDGIMKIGNSQNDDKPFAGVQVQLFDATSNSLVAITTTDANGNYRFYGTSSKYSGNYLDEMDKSKDMKELLINPLHKYYVEFVYNGQMYQPTTYNQSIASPGGYSNAKYVSENQRITFNYKFKTIASDSGNYDGSKRAYGTSHKIKNTSGDYIQYNSGTAIDSSNDNNQVVSTALTYGDVWNKFLNYATHSSDNFTLVTNTSTNKGPLKFDGSLQWGNVGSALKWEDDGTNYSESSEIATDGINYEVAINALNKWLQSMNVAEINEIDTFIKDSMITASTLQGGSTYPVTSTYCINDVENEGKPEDKINIGNAGTYPYLYRTDSDQARYVDYGVCKREQADLALSKDAYKVMLQVNGKQETYYYSKKNLDDDGSWRITDRKGNGLFNGADYYKRQIRASEYLFNGKDSYGTDADNDKNLRAWVTYKIAIKNQGTVNVDLNDTEVVDYYDASQYTYSPEKENPYVGNKKGEGVGSILSIDEWGSKYNREKDNIQKKSIPNGYSKLYITGLKTTNNGAILTPGDISYMYITFEVNKPNSKIIIDQNLNNGTEGVGKKNIAEINAYTTRYTGNQEVPNVGNVGQDYAGLIDVDSNPGNLSDKDLDGNGNIINSQNDWENRHEDDTDKAPNMKFVIDNNNIRKFSGTVFEDERTENSNKAKVGNGKYDSGENTINGVTVQLVELVQNVNGDGTPTGTYKGEKIWATYNYGSTTDFSNVQTDYGRYYSGTDKSKVIISGPQGSILYVGQEGLSKDQGQYEFNSIPAGDFYVRFIYGDTTQTTLMNANNDVNSLVGTSVDGLSGLNAKSYNGQDYKSTVYQTGVDQNGSYNEIYGYSKDHNNNYESQNYEKVNDINYVANGTIVQSVSDTNSNNSNIANTGYAVDDKNTMYYYNIPASETNNLKARVSDAKDVYAYRQDGNDYASSNDVNGTINVSSEGVKNNKAEILRSFSELATDITNRKSTINNYDYQDTDKQEQAEMIRNFMNNTKMVAQTGIINIEVESNTPNTSESNMGDGHTYVINDLDLGLVERPRAQLKLNKEIENFKITLANGQVLFDTDKSVKDLSFSKHKGHSINGVNNLSLALEKNNKYNRLGGFRLESVNVSSNNRSTPELLQLYMDDELLEGATMNAIYRLTVTNVGEVDYLDKQFYYSGQTNNASEGNISKTNAKDVIDYVSNSIIFDNSKNTQWNITTPEEQTSSSMVFANSLKDNIEEAKNNNSNVIANENSYGNYIVTKKDNIKNDYINRTYLQELNTYNTLIHTTSGLSGELLPEMISSDKSSATTTLELSSLLSTNTSGDNLIYNNLSEITATTNSQGRRMQFSVVGNQQMADQQLGNNAAADAYSSDDLVTPSEIDADSAQKILIMPPTGANKNYIPIIASVIAGAAIIIVAVILIRKYTKKGKEE